MQKKAIIIGSGIAGLASALRLRKKNYEVSVFEANAYPGGKLHEISSDGFRWDAGPSLFTMPFLVDELFSLFDKDPKSYFRYSRKENLCNYFWDDGTSFTAPASREAFINKAAETFNEKVSSLEKYISRSEEKYNITSGVFLERSLHKVGNYLNIDTVGSLIKSYKLNVFSSLNSYNKRQFSNPKLIQLFDRFATYNGSSPYKTPGIMSLIPHMEMFYGCYFPKGGMHQINKSLYQLAKDVGINFHFSEKVREIRYFEGKVTGVKTPKGIYDSDLVISNMDVHGTFRHLLPEVKAPEKILTQERSSSALIYYWGINREFQELDLHNILFSNDYKREFDGLFGNRGLTADPSVYINISSKEEKTDAPSGCENWFVMINVPSNYGQNWQSLKNEARKNIINKINKTLNVSIEDHIVKEDTLDPVLIEKRTSSYRGSLYGTSSNSKFAAFLRHPNFTSRLKGLYFCGGSVHPGGGIPLCLYSAKIVSDLIQAA